MSFKRYNLVLCLLAFVGTFAFSKDVELKLEADSDDFKTFEGNLGPIPFKVYSPKDGSELTKVLDANNNEVFVSSDPNQSPFLVFLDFGANGELGVVLNTFDGTNEGTLFKLKDGDKWNDVDPNTFFSTFYPRPKAEGAKAQAATHFTLDLANLESNANLQLGFENTRGDLQLSLFKAKQHSHVFNEVKHGDHTLLENQGDALESAFVKFVEFGEQKFAFFFLFFSGDRLEVKTSSFKDSKWTTQDGFPAPFEQSNLKHVYNERLVYT